MRDGRSLYASFEESSRAQVRLDLMQFTLGAVQSCTTMKLLSGVVAGHSTLRCLYAVPCAFEVGYGVLAGLRPCALLARFFRCPLNHFGENGRPASVSARHCAP